MLAFHLYLSENGRRVFAVPLHPNADHMDLFMKEVVAEHGVRAYDFLEHGSERWDAFGPLHAATADAIRQYGVELTHHPYPPRRVHPPPGRIGNAAFNALRPRVLRHRTVGPDRGLDTRPHQDCLRTVPEPMILKPSPDSPEEPLTCGFVVGLAGFEPATP
jgi:hypothetical protein